MANRTRFAGTVNAIAFNYGGAGDAPPPSGVLNGNSVTGSGTITLTYGQVGLSDGTNIAPFNINAPITVGLGSSQETVTPSAVSNPTPGVYGSCQITATFNQLHGGDPVASGTFGLQEAINFIAGQGGGTVNVDGPWYTAGGTIALIQAASLPTNGLTRIFDITTGETYSNSSASLTVVAAPSAATSALVASQVGVVGTWTAVTEHVLFTYVTANGGETLASADYSFTATVSLAIGGTGPAAATGAVGYKVYIGANATTTCYQVPVTAANGTVIQCGPLAAFKIGTPFSVATATTSAGNLPPLVQSTAFGTVQPVPFADQAMAQVFQTVYPPFAVTGVVTAGTAIEWGKVNLPTGFLNYVGRTLRIKLNGYYTPVSTATLIITMELHSVYNTTKTTMFTVTTPASSGTTAADINGELFLRTASLGATGTIECHGYIIYGGATGTAGLLVAAGDSVIAASSAADLTKQDALVITVNSGTANLTQSQLRTLIVEVLA